MNKDQQVWSAEFLHAPPLPPEPHHKKLYLIIGIAVFITAISIAGYFVINQQTSTTSIACTLEAKICPDGSAVTRTGPNCEFAACPVTTGPDTQISNWQTYRNEEFGFEIRYPGDKLEAIDNFALFYEPAVLDSRHNVCFAPLLRTEFYCEIELYITTSAVEELTDANYFLGFDRCTETASLVPPRGNFNRFGVAICDGQEIIYKNALAEHDGLTYILVTEPDIGHIDDSTVDIIFKNMQSTFQFIDKNPHKDGAATQVCGFYTYNGKQAEYCAACGNNICERFESCTSSYCTDEVCTDDCGSLYCPNDCENQEEAIQDKRYCEFNEDCVLMLCTGAVNKQWAESVLPESPCATYVEYTGTICTNNICTPTN